MTKLVTTCLLGAGLMAAATTLPQSQAHEGHDGRDHAATQRNEAQGPSNRVIDSPPPFETLDNAPAPGRSPSSSTRDNQRQAPERNWSDPADRRPELSSPRAEASGVRPFSPTAPETFPRHSDNDYYPESRNRDDFANRLWTSPDDSFSYPLDRQDAHLGDYPSPDTLGGWCPHAVQPPRSLHDDRPKSSYFCDRNPYQVDSHLPRDYQREYDCPFASAELRGF